MIYDFDHKSILNIYDYEKGKNINKILIDIDSKNEFLYPTSIAYLDNYFITAFSDGTLIKFDKDGNKSWETTINDILKTPIKIHNKFLILLTSNKILGVDFMNGSIKWEFTYDNDNPLNTQKGSVISYKNILYFLLPNGRLGEIDTFISAKNNSEFTGTLLKQNYFQNK